MFGQPAIYGPDNQVRQASLYSNRFLFTGREYNANFGFYEYRARAYHPSLGRFMSEDPKLFDAGDYNLFRYCHNDPVDNVDPMGLDTLVIYGEQRDDSSNRFGHVSIGMTGQGVFSFGTQKGDWGISAKNFITRESEHRTQRAFIIRTTAEQEAAIRKSLETRRDKPLPNVYRHPVDAYNDNCSTRVRDALNAGDQKIGNAHFPGSLANALEKEAKEGKVEKVTIPAKSNSAPEQLKQFEPGAQPNRTDFKIELQKDKAAEIISNLEHGLNPKPQ